MTTLYRPVLIESAEQAEALPVGTVAHRVLKFESTWDTIEQPEVAVKIGINAWCATAVDDDAWDWLDRHLVGWSALVPIEAEEETQGITTWPRPDDAPWPKRSHLCEDSAGDYYYRDEDGVAHDITEEMTHWLAAQPVRTRLVTPWEEA